MRPPRVVRLLSQRIPVRLVKAIDISDTHGEGALAYGAFEADVPIITLSREQGCERMRETFVHENLHLMFAHAKLSEGEVGEEECINRLAPILLSWLRENSTAIEYLRRRDG